MGRLRRLAGVLLQVVWLPLEAAVGAARRSGDHELLAERAGTAAAAAPEQKRHPHKEYCTEGWKGWWSAKEWVRRGSAVAEASTGHAAGSWADPLFSRDG